MNTTVATLTSTTRALRWCLHLLVIGLLVITGSKAIVDDEPRAAVIVPVAAICGLVYAVGPSLPRVQASRRIVLVWLAVLSMVWLILVTVSAEAVWLAFPLYFLQLHFLPRYAGLAAVSLTAAAAVAAFATHQGSFSPAMAVGPTLGAAVAVAVVWGYQTIHRESERRARLIAELTAARADLAAAEHTSGVLAERQRLSREIHDTLAQDLSSIQLMLRATQRCLPDSADKAAEYVDQARRTAADSLAEARRFVAALTPPALEGTSLAHALERLCATTSGRNQLAARFHLTGIPQPLARTHEVALLRVAQSALSNTVRHAHAGKADVTLSYLGDRVAVDIVDDGDGFDPDRVAAPCRDDTGFGLAAMRARMHSLDGTLTIESAPQGGTALAAQLPLVATEAEVHDD